MNDHQATVCPAGLSWVKSSHSGTSGGECVEVATAPGTVHIRDSKNIPGPVLRFPDRQWEAFLSHTAGRPGAAD
ncbi:DUF397 domain-containing protein [Streptomyces sp. TRM 70361]|uniref:DUF397 domain-containing protein n=1 Tax=Streptomyces sp. TRM 70361 TaxID=3116553 RepID=UPI002E7C5606|nr:DUF397 domain-containing protein [Streptomyces sp. TRM 70361]MEE1942903.1 DUF397 domain-containing protein [Streptomyces sp. TRM 70361]